MRSLLALLLIVCTSLYAEADKKPAYVDFELPDKWKCDLSQGVWICQSTVEAERKEAVMLSIATNATEWDTLENYETYLKQTRSISDEEGKPITSKVTYSRKRNINGVNWVDSLHFNSELPGFWARYVATVQKNLAVLITYIVSDEYYSRIAPQFERMVASLKPKLDFDVNVASRQGENELPGSRKLGVNELLKDRLNIGKKKPASEAPPAAEPQELPLGLIVGVGGALVVFIVFRRIQGRKKKAPGAPPARRVG